MVGTVQPTEGWLDQEGRGKATVLSPCSGTPSPLAFGHQFLILRPLDCAPYTSGPPSPVPAVSPITSSQSFSPRLNYVASFPSSLAGKGQMVELLGLHSYVSQFCVCVCVRARAKFVYLAIHSSSKQILTISIDSGEWHNQLCVHADSSVWIWKISGSPGRHNWGAGDIAGILVGEMWANPHRHWEPLALCSPDPANKCWAPTVYLEVFWPLELQRNKEPSLP